MALVSTATETGAQGCRLHRVAAGIRHAAIGTNRKRDAHMAQHDKSNPGNFADDRARASEAGKKGGQHSHGGSHDNPGNFAQNPERAAEAGRKGGEHSSGSFAQDHEKAAEAGRKGGQHSHGGHGSGN
ncbi:hypothetical protein Asru_0231_05 [Acidisphaera rubrifaciens HS-AP3]|uniref:Stress-induced acidophilic repeat motif-containing protein n=2 Tax=Acidisphaera TaxID=50714 RepID=A0A0D6P793_9PROT|nr:hypothetical protein Asru_0231_05 [Acidisphaera rubrifaciens HS-AP3]